MVTDADYPTGATISGVPWRKEFTELRIIVSNPSNRNYDDISLLIRPTEPIALIQQIVTNVPDVFFTDKNQFSVRIADVSSTGKALAIPLVLLTTDAGYTMHCPRLPARTSIQILIALADIRWNPPAERDDRPIQEKMLDEDYVARVKFDDFSTYWIGHTNADVYTPRPTPQWVKVEGEYTVWLRTRAIFQKIELAKHSSLPFAF